MSASALIAHVRFRTCSGSHPRGASLSRVELSSNVHRLRLRTAFLPAALNGPWSYSEWVKRKKNSPGVCVFFPLRRSSFYRGFFLCARCVCVALIHSPPPLMQPANGRYAVDTFLHHSLMSY